MIGDYIIGVKSPDATDFMFVPQFPKRASYTFISEIANANEKNPMVVNILWK